MYTDSSGESFCRSLDNAFLNVFKAAVKVVVALATISVGITIAWIGMTICSLVGTLQFVASGFQNSTIFTNQFKIVGGLFQGNIEQIASGFTKEFPQKMLGMGLALGFNPLGKVNSISYYGGSTVIKTYRDRVPFTKKTLGVTLGSYIIGNNTIESEPNNSLFQHEYGHYLQSQASGWNYLLKFGFPSAGGKEEPEYDANSRAFSYFYKETGVNLKWDFYNHQLNDNKNWGLNPSIYYNNPAFQQALSSSLISTKW